MNIQHTFQAMSRFLKGQMRLVFILLVFLVALRASLPFIVKWYVNKTLAAIPEYQGEIRDIDLHLWRGAYTIKDLNIVKTTGKVPVPFFSAPRIDLSIQWKVILQGIGAGKMKIYSPVINFVNGPTDSTTQVGVDQPWFNIIKELFPLRLNYCEIEDGSVHYRDFHSAPPLDLKLDHIHILIKNLINSERLSNALPSVVEVDGRAFESSNFVVHAQVNPWKEKATFYFTFKLDGVPLTKLNDFFQAYGNFNFKKGTFILTSECAASNGTLVGSVTPLLDDVEVVDLGNIKNPPQLVWEGLVGGLLRLLRNQPKNRFATKIPLRGDFSDPHAVILPALGNIFKNAFIRAYTDQIDQEINLKSAEKAEEDLKGKSSP